MLLYLFGAGFSDQTFVVKAEPHHSILRVKAEFLHALYNLGFASLKFDLLYKDELLQDGMSLLDYGIYRKTNLTIRSYRSEPDDAELQLFRELLEEEVHTQNEVRHKSFYVKCLLGFLFVAGMFSFFSHYGWECSWNMTFPGLALLASWKQRTFGLKVFLYFTPACIIGNLVVYAWYLFVVNDELCTSAVEAWYCYIASYSLIPVIVIASFLCLNAIWVFLQALKFEAGDLFEEHYKDQEHYQGIQLLCRSDNVKEQIHGSQLLYQHLNEGGDDACKEFVEKKYVTCLRALVYPWDDGINYYLGRIYGLLSESQDLRPELALQGCIGHLKKLLQSRKDDVATGASEAIIHWTRRPEDIKELDKAVIEPTLRVMAEIRNEPMCSDAREALDNIRAFRAKE